MLVKTKKGCTWYGAEIADDTYNEILSMLRNPPEAAQGCGYRLKADLTWEQYALPENDPDPELTAEEAMNIILGGAV